MWQRQKYIEIQLRRAWADLLAYAKQQLPGAIFTLLASIFVAPAVAKLGGIRLMDQLGIIVATSLAGPIAIFIIAFATFFFIAPGRIHKDTNQALLNASTPPAPVTATILTLLILLTFGATTGAWLAEHQNAAAWRTKYNTSLAKARITQNKLASRAQEDLQNAWWWAKYWRSQASKRPSVIRVPQRQLETKTEPPIPPSDIPIIIVTANSVRKDKYSNSIVSVSIGRTMSSFTPPWTLVSARISDNTQMAKLDQDSSHGIFDKLRFSRAMPINISLPSPSSLWSNPNSALIILNIWIKPKDMESFSSSTPTMFIKFRNSSGQLIERPFSIHLSRTPLPEITAG